MGAWSAYFLLKLLLYARGDIAFNPWLNLLFAAFTALMPQNARQRFAKNLITVPLGIMLLYYESPLPPMTQLIARGVNLDATTVVYLWLLVYRAVSWKLVAECAGLLVIYGVARRKLRMSTLAFLGILFVVLAPAAHMPALEAARASAAEGVTSALRDGDARNMRTPALEARLAQFYADQSALQVRFARVAQDATPYDILLLHVSSLSWDDMRTLNRPDDPLFSRFDILLTRFNSAASYDVPAAIRLLRGACGQTTERELYERAAPECLVVNDLEDAGFEFHWLLNFDGRVEKFEQSLRNDASLTTLPDVLTDVTVAQHAVDGSPVYDDYSTLSHWLKRRESNPAARVLLYYNSISLRDDNRTSGAAAGSASYGARVSALSAGLNRFLDDLQRSGRHTVVVFVAEHGAARNGDRHQIPGLREIPTTAIAHVPVGIALINAGRPPRWAQRRIDAPTSYFALHELLARFLSDNPFDEPIYSPDAATQGLPLTPFVAENNGVTVMQIGGQSMLRGADGAWSSLESSLDP